MGSVLLPAGDQQKTKKHRSSEDEEVGDGNETETENDDVEKKGKKKSRARTLSRHASEQRLRCVTCHTCKTVFPLSCIDMEACDRMFRECSFCSFNNLLKTVPSYQ